MQSSLLQGMLDHSICNLYHRHKPMRLYTKVYTWCSNNQTVSIDAFGVPSESIP